MSTSIQTPRKVDDVSDDEFFDAIAGPFEEQEFDDNLQLVQDHHIEVDDDDSSSRLTPLAPPPERVFPTFQALQSWLHKYTSKRGYGTRLDGSIKRDANGNITRRMMVCDRATVRQWKPKSVINRRRDRGTRATGCQAKFVAKYNQYLGIWTIRTLRGEHNHPPSMGADQHPSIRRFIRRRELSEMIRSEVRLGRSRAAIIERCLQEYPEVPMTPSDITNAVHKTKVIDRAGLNSLQALLTKLDQGDWIHFETFNEYTASLTKLLFFHPKSLELWHKNCDIVLIDSTYKTNRFGLPLVNIVGSTANNKSFFIGACFMTAENIANFTWLLSRLKQVYTQSDHPLPRIFITDADNALIPSIKEVFPDSKHFLCAWHINKAVQTWIKKFFKGKQLENELVSQQDVENAQNKIQDQTVQFQGYWNKVMYATTRADCVKAVLELRDQYQSESPLIDYLAKTWLSRGEMFIRCHVDEFLHFGNVTTSRLEGMHSVLKQALQTSYGDIGFVVSKFEKLMLLQNKVIFQSEGSDKIIRRPGFEKPFWARVIGHISTYALTKIRSLIIDLDITATTRLNACTGSFTRAWGLPCPHYIQELLASQEPLEVTDFDPHWRLDRYNLPELYWKDIAQDPQPVPRRRHYNRLGLERRDPTLFERVDQSVQELKPTQRRSPLQ